MISVVEFVRAFGGLGASVWLIYKFGLKLFEYLDKRSIRESETNNNILDKLDKLPDSLMVLANSVTESHIAAEKNYADILKILTHQNNTLQIICNRLNKEEEKNGAKQI